MEQLSLIEKLGMLMKIIFSSPFFLILLIIITVFLLLLLKFNKKLKKDKSIYLKLYIIFFILIFIKYGSSILKLCDNLVENIFTDIYFPSLSIYVIMLFISNIILIITIISNKKKKGVKIFNTVCYTSIQFLAILILDIIIKENVNIYEKLEVYTNERLLVLIELSMGLFVLWILTLFVIKCINLLSKKYEKEDQEQIITKLDVDPIEILDFDLQPKTIKEIYNVNTIEQEKNNWIDFDKLNNQFNYNMKNDIKEDIEIIDFELDKTQDLSDILNADDYKYIKAVLKYAKDNNELDKINKKMNK